MALVTAAKFVSRGLRRAFGPKFVKHYVQPRRVRGEQVPYDAKRFFESWHRASPEALSDADTIAAGRSRLDTRYHYNAVENAIIDYFAAHPLPRDISVLDVGSGAGHWIDFYREIFGATVVGTEISGPAVRFLRERYDGNDDVGIVEADVASPSFALDQKFQIVNAVGVMFHIIEDERWERAVANLAAHLVAGGSLVVGGQFGLLTQNVQFHHTDDFSSWDEIRAARGSKTLVNKRIRSLRRWRRCARRAGLRIEGVNRTTKSSHVLTPENNVLVLSVPPDPARGGSESPA
jgi:SAM-dependent methyltransferase